MQYVSSSTEYYNQKIVIFSVSRTVLLQKGFSKPARSTGGHFKKNNVKERFCSRYFFCEKKLELTR